MFIRDDMKACLQAHERLPFMSLKLMFQPPKGKLQVFRHGRLQAGGGRVIAAFFSKRGAISLPFEKKFVSLHLQYCRRTAADGI